jgi:heme A synthase
VIVQLGLGGLNLLLAAPVWMQLVHLLVSDLIWIAMVWLTALSTSQVVYEADLIGVSV